MNQDTLIVQRGECLRAQIDYTNEDGTAINLTDYTLACPEASHPELQAGVVLTFEDAVKGIATVYVPAAVMAELPYGRASWLRFAVTPSAGGCASISMKMWVDIQ